MRAGILALALPLMLAACGESSNDNSTKQSYTAVKTVGDSLADSGKADGSGRSGVLSAGAPATLNPLWNDLVAGSFGIKQCSYYWVSQTACSNYAIGGAQINFQNSAPTYSVDNSTQKSITKQLIDMGANGYAKGDLVLAIGGGNDAATVFTNYATLLLQGAVNPNAKLPMLIQASSLLDPATVNSMLSGAASTYPTMGATLGHMYMTALANHFADTITANVLDKGASHVVVVNMPNVVLTPKLRLTLDGFEAASYINHATRLQLEAVVTDWVTEYNNQLAARFARDKRVVVVDFGKALTDLVNDPAQYGFTNSKDPACPSSGVCTDALLSATTPPTGASGGTQWWSTYAFADTFHPTPLGYKLLAQRVNISMAQAGWL